MKLDFKTFINEPRRPAEYCRVTLEGAMVYYCWNVDYTVDYGRAYLLDETCCFMW